jgi:hypothetical protein
MEKNGGALMAINVNSFNFDDTVVGVVLDIDKDTRRVAVHIPKIMPAISEYTPYSRVVGTSNGTRVIGTEFNSTVKIRNSMWVNPQRYDEPLPKIGSKVIIWFLDENPKNAYWLPFNPNGSYERIDEEKFKKLFNLQIVNRDIPIFEEDAVTINFPENFSSSYITDGKDKKLNILYRDNYIVSTSEPLEPFSGMMWFEPASEQLRVYKGDRFVNVVTQDTVTDLYNEVGRISDMMREVLSASSSGRLFFVSRLSNAPDAKNGDIVAINSARAGSGYYNYTKVASTTWNPSTMDNGIYYVQYINKIIEVINGNSIELIAYKYDTLNEGWESLDGWILSSIPTYTARDIVIPSGTVNIDALNISFNDSTSAFENFDLRIVEISMENVDMSKLAGFRYQFYTTNDEDEITNIGLEFTITEDSGAASGYEFQPPVYSSSSYLIAEDDSVTIIVPDLPKNLGIPADNLKCKVTPISTLTVDTTINFGDIDISAKYRRG